MSALPKRKCHACQERAPYEDTTLVRRAVGGNYRRAASSQPCVICRTCVERYLPQTVLQGYMTVDRWSIHGIRAAAERFGIPVPPREKRYRDE